MYKNQKLGNIFPPSHSLLMLIPLKKIRRAPPPCTPSSLTSFARCSFRPLNHSFIGSLTPVFKELDPQRIEYIERNLPEKSVKRPFCCTVSIPQVYFTYLCYITFWALEYHFIENLKLLLKENQKCEIGQFHN